MLPDRTKQRKQNRIAKILISVILLILVTVISFKCAELRQKRSEYAQREQELQEQIGYETERADKIAEYETYTKTKAYVEDVARDKLGLVYQGEILFRNENRSN